MYYILRNRTFQSILLIKLFYTLNKTPIGETGCLSIQFFNLPPFLNTVSQDTFGTLPLTVQCLRDLRDVMPLHWSPSTSHQTLPKEAEEFPSHGKYPKDMPLPNLSNNSGLIFKCIKSINCFTCGEQICKLAV